MDLHSYVCTFEDCNAPDRLFESRYQWFDHEMQAHRRWWQCVEGCDKPFHSKLSFEAHLQQAHADLSGGAHLPTLMRMCERKANMGTHSDCSLCHHPFTSLVQLRGHMGQHHEQLALFAIPSNLDQTEEDAFEARSINEAEIDSIGSGRTNSEVAKDEVASDKETVSDVQINEFHEASGNIDHQQSAMAPASSSISESSPSGAQTPSGSKLDEAEKIYMRALQGYEEALGLKHISTLQTVNNLGNLYANQGKLAEADKTYERVLRGFNEALGPKHTSTLQTANNLGNLYELGQSGRGGEDVYPGAARI